MTDQGRETDRARARLVDSDASAGALDDFDRAVSRRSMLRWAGGAAGLLAAFGAGQGTALDGLFGRGLIPAAWAAEGDDKPTIAGKDGMTVHASRPINGEFAPHQLDDDVTPIARHFVRNNGRMSARARSGDLQGWTLTIDGEVERPLTLGMADLEAMPAVTLDLLVECGGNGRALFEPPVRGNPWKRGAVGCSRWTGVRLADVLKRAGLRSRAVYTAHYGDDPPLGKAEPFSRGVPIDKAMDAHTILAYRMNGERLPALHGFPLRVIAPGWVGSCSQKWLNRVWVRDQVHDSQKMKGYAYRVPSYPVTPGKRPPESDMEIATAWPIKSLITRPGPAATAGTGRRVEVAGHAWAGEQRVAKVEISTDYGVSWAATQLAEPPNRFAWARWTGSVRFERHGYYEIWARAHDDQGHAQPYRQPWNPKGYLGNVIHRVPIQVSA